ncbi:MAG: chromate transporter [Bryobacteraceae bacterium]
MNLILLYLLLAKATFTSFSGLSSLPIIRNELVLDRAVITDRQLNTAVAVSRMTPGPMGLYVVCVGYYAAGLPGAAAGFLAMVTPAFLIVPLLAWFSRRAQTPLLRQAISAVTLAAAGLVLATTIPFARDAFTGALPVSVAAASFALLAFTSLDTLWVIGGSAVAGMLRILLVKP